MGEESKLTAEQLHKKEAFIAARGYWRPWTEDLLAIDPDFLESYGRYAARPVANGPLSRRMTELVYVALDCSATHMFVSGAVLHMRLALEAGATTRDITDVLRLATAQGLDGCFTGIEILAEELAAVNRSPERTELTVKQIPLRERYIEAFGEWPGYCEYLLLQDSIYFEAMLDVLDSGRKGDGLSQCEAALIRVALSACFTGLERAALRRSIRRALQLAVPAQQIEQVLKMTAHLGVHACVVGLPALREARRVSLKEEQDVT
jgi:hypothetical protein